MTLGSKKINGAEALLRVISEEGIDTVFGYPGGTIIPIYDKLFDVKDKINHILVRHEQAAVHAAEGYARSTGKVGICFATSGPGATNFVTGIADAMMDSTPVVCITAQVNADKLGTNFFQEADIISITLPITKWSYQITSAQEIPDVMAKAFYIASSGRPGPVLVSLTKNAQTELIDYKYDRDSIIDELRTSHKSSPFASSPEIKRRRIDERISETIKLLNNSQKPLIIAGHGVSISHAWDELEQCVNNGNIPVAVTLLGLGIIDCDNPRYLGMVGMHGNIAPNNMTQEADVILAVGMRFSDRVTGELTSYAPKAKVIHIDIDEAEFNKNVNTHIKLHGDAKEILNKIASGLKFSERREWMDFAREKREYEEEMIMRPQLSGSGMIRMAQVVDSVNRNTRKDKIVVTDVGQNQMFTARYIKIHGRMKWITSGGLGTMGFGLPAAIGAGAGNPGSEVIVFCGDGGLQMNIQELGTLLQTGIPVKIILLNNSVLGMVRQWQDLFYDKRYSYTTLVNPDFQKLFEAYSIAHRKVTSLSRLNEAIKEMESYEKSFLLEVIVNENDNVFPMIPAGKSLNNIILK